MTLLLTNEEVERSLTPEDAILATESIYRELADGRAVNRPRSPNVYYHLSHDQPSRFSISVQRSQ